jgi:threonine dehydrogenase-like Zn-dependent dehydrogenase
MQGTVLYGPRDIRFENREEPRIQKPTDAIIRMAATCVCGSDLWPYRGIQKITQPTPMGHEYCGIVEEVGSEVKTIKPGQFVIGSFCISDNTCPSCQIGYQSGCQNLEFMSRAQAPILRVPWADGTLVATPGLPPDDLLLSLLAVSDVLGTGWFAADAANVKPGSTVAVIGDGAVGLLGVLSAKQMGAGRIIAMSRHPNRQRLAEEFGDRHRDRTWRRGSRAHQGNDEPCRRGLRARVRRNRRVHDAGDPVYASGRIDRLCRCASRSQTGYAATVLQFGPSPRRPCTGSAVSSRFDQARLGSKDQPWESIRSCSASRRRR